MAIFSLLTALVLSLGYTSWLRFHLVPKKFAFIPAESNIIFASGDISSLWDGIDYHFGKVIQDFDNQLETSPIHDPAAALTPLGKPSQLSPETESEQDESRIPVLEEIVVSEAPETFFEVNHQQGFLTEAILAYRDALEEIGIPVNSKHDLQNKYGIDVSRGLLAGYSPEMTSTSNGDEVTTQEFTVLIPLAKIMIPAEPGKSPSVDESLAEDLTVDDRSPREKFTAFFSTLSGLELVEQPCGDSVGVEERVVGFGSEFILSFPRNDMAMLSSSCKQFTNSMINQDRNLKHARQDDWLFEAAQRQLRRPLLTGSGLLLVLRGLTLDFAPALRIAMSVNFTPDSLLANLHLETESLQARLVRNLLKPAIPEHEWRHLLSRETGAVLLNKDRSIPEYLELASYGDESQLYLTEMYGGILDRIRQFEQTDQILLAAENFQDDIPLLLLGIWGPQPELAKQLLEMQGHLRRARDLTVLNNAASVWRIETDQELNGIEDLISSRYLTPDSRCGREDLDWLDTYSYQEGVFQQLGTYPREAFKGEDYVYSYRNHPVYFLDSCVTENDLRFRLDTGPEDEVGDLLSLIEEISMTLETTSGLPEAWFAELTESIISTTNSVEYGDGMWRTRAVTSLENVIKLLEQPTALPPDSTARWINSIRSLIQRLSSVSPAGKILMENRYRLAATLLDDSLWIASTSDQINSLIDRSLDNQRPFGFELGSTIRANKLHLILHISSLIEHGLLSGDSKLEEFTVKVLLDFRYHSELNLSLQPIRWGRSLELEADVKGPAQVLLP